MTGPPPLLAFRQATIDDLPAIVAMRDELNQLELAGCPYAPIRKLSVEQFTADWGKSFDDPNYFWCLVEAAGKPAGFALIYLMTPSSRPPGAFIHWAFLRPPQRRRGAGRMLFDHLAAWARERGANRIELQFIEGNEDARQFWARIGFRPFAQKCVDYFDSSAATQRIS
jgi:GNAT superfamily N-acetyltransferase